MGYKDSEGFTEINGVEWASLYSGTLEASITDEGIDLLSNDEYIYMEIPADKRNKHRPLYEILLYNGTKRTLPTLSIEDGEGEVYDDVMDALNELLYAMSYYEEKAKDGYDLRKARDEVYDRYSMEKVKRTYKYYDAIRRDWQ